MSRLIFAMLLLISLPIFAAQSNPPDQTGPGHEVPVVRAGLGECSVDFHVIDDQRKPIYGAQISVHIRYGFGGFHKMDLQVATNVDGRGRFDGLTERARMPLEFNLEAPQHKSNSVAVDLRDKCKSTQEVVLPSNR